MIDCESGPWIRLSEEPCLEMLTFWHRTHGPLIRWDVTQNSGSKWCHITS